MSADEPASPPPDEHGVEEEEGASGAVGPSDQQDGENVSRYDEVDDEGGEADHSKGAAGDNDSQGAGASQGMITELQDEVQTLKAALARQTEETEARSGEVACEVQTLKAALARQTRETEARSGEVACASNELAATQTVLERAAGEASRLRDQLTAIESTHSAVVTRFERTISAAEDRDQNLNQQLTEASDDARVMKQELSLLRSHQRLADEENMFLQGPTERQRRGSIVDLQQAESKQVMACILPLDERELPVDAMTRQLVSLPLFAALAIVTVPMLVCILTSTYGPVPETSSLITPSCSPFNQSLFADGQLPTEQHWNETTREPCVSVSGTISGLDNYNMRYKLYLIMKLSTMQEHFGITKRLAMVLTYEGRRRLRLPGHCDSSSSPASSSEALLAAVSGSGVSGSGGDNWQQLLESGGGGGGGNSSDWEVVYRTGYTSNTSRHLVCPAEGTDCDPILLLDERFIGFRDYRVNVTFLSRQMVLHRQLLTDYRFNFRFENSQFQIAELAIRSCLCTLLLLTLARTWVVVRRREALVPVERVILALLGGAAFYSGPLFVLTFVCSDAVANSAMTFSLITEMIYGVALLYLLVLLCNGLSASKRVHNFFSGSGIGSAEAYCVQGLHALLLVACITNVMIARFLVPLDPSDDSHSTASAVAEWAVSLIYVCVAVYLLLLSLSLARFRTRWAPHLGQSSIMWLRFKWLLFSTLALAAVFLISLCTLAGMSIQGNNPLYFTNLSLFSMYPVMLSYLFIGPPPRIVHLRETSSQSTISLVSGAGLASSPERGGAMRV